jgi:CubicO group peptidase (beta-lactamase class C family)
MLAISAAWLTGCSQFNAPIQPSPNVISSTFDQAKLDEVGIAVNGFIEKKQLPGAVYHLERNKTIVEKSYGRQTYDDAAPIMDANTLFDVASLTKVVATTPAIMMLIEDGKLSLDTKLATIFPDCSVNGKSDITVRHLFTHTSGLAAGLSATPAWNGAAESLKRACAQTPTHAPGTFFRYSDINFILLGHIVQEISGKTLAQFVDARLFKPLGMHASGYLPLVRIASPPILVNRIAPTQIIKEDGIERALQGVVHDPTARRMGGIAGHAGLFTTSRDLARFARMLLNEGELDGVRVLSVETIRLMRSVQTPMEITARRGLGFDIDSPFARPRGSVFPIGSYGHTGFTGCILWIDPYSKTFYVFLSNRVYPNEGTNILPLYAVLGTLSAQAIRNFDFAVAPSAQANR